MTDDLTAAIGDLAAALEGVTLRRAGSVVEFLRGDVLFAVLDGPSLLVSLKDDLADAAVRTPDATRSDRGSSWVALHPTTLDDFAIDRARAWFESAWRFAGEP